MAIRNSADDSDVVGFTNMGNTTSAKLVWTVDDSSIHSFYAVVRAVDINGNMSSEAIGDGFYSKAIDTLLAKFSASDYDGKNYGDLDYFGHSVALSESYLAVGVYNGEAVYVYDLAKSNAETKIIASDGAADDYFGQQSLSLSVKYPCCRGLWI